MRLANVGGGIALGLGGIFLWWLLQERDTWQGFYYPDGCLTCETINSPIFDSKAACLNWANYLQASRYNINDDFECGLNCKASSLDDLKICEETVDS